MESLIQRELVHMLHFSNPIILMHEAKRYCNVFSGQVFLTHLLITTYDLESKRNSYLCIYYAVQHISTYIAIRIIEGKSSVGFIINHFCTKPNLKSFWLSVSSRFTPMVTTISPFHCNCRGITLLSSLAQPSLPGSGCGHGDCAGARSRADARAWCGSD